MANFVISKTQNAAKVTNENTPSLRYMYPEIRCIQIRYKQTLLYTYALVQ